MGFEQFVILLCVSFNLVCFVGRILCLSQSLTWVFSTLLEIWFFVVVAQISTKLISVLCTMFEIVCYMVKFEFLDLWMWSYSVSIFLSFLKI